MLTTPTFLQLVFERIFARSVLSIGQILKHPDGLILMLVGCYFKLTSLERIINLESLRAAYSDVYFQWLVACRIRQEPV